MYFVCVMLLGFMCAHTQLEGKTILKEKEERWMLALRGIINWKPCMYWSEISKNVCCLSTTHLCISLRCMQTPVLSSALKQRGA